MRRPVIAGNWKMYKTQAEARAYFSALVPLVRDSVHCDIIVAPPFTALAAAVDAVQGTPISIAAQDMHGEPEGAFTGEVSAPMLVEVGCRAVIIGHSERRQFFGETDESANKKVKTALASGLTPILCVGELLAERENGATEKVLRAPTPRWPGRVDRCGVLAYHPCLRAGMGDWHGPHGDAGNGRRGAQVPAAAGGSKFYRGSRCWFENPLRRQRQTRQH